MRLKNRANNETRSIEILRNYTKHAEGSVLIKCGDTHVICNASIEEKVPSFLKGKNQGWVTAEYGMLPRSTSSRMARESSRGKQSGRTQEIQRLIGRSLRQAVNLKYIKGKTINIDCDVIQADGGTRTASITGGCVALFLALQNHHDDHRAIRSYVAAVSLGILGGQVALDLDYKEDSGAEVDLNLVMTDGSELIEIQGTGEEAPFSKEQLNEMLEVGSSAIADIIEKQKACLK